MVQDGWFADRPTEQLTTHAAALTASYFDEAIRRVGLPLSWFSTPHSVVGAEHLSFMKVFSSAIRAAGQSYSILHWRENRRRSVAVRGGSRSGRRARYSSCELAIRSPK